MIPEIMDSCASTSVLKSAKTSLRNSSSSPHCCMASGQSITSVCVDIFFYEPQDAQERIINDAIEMPMKQRKVVEAQVAAGYLLCVCCADYKWGIQKARRSLSNPATLSGSFGSRERSACGDSSMNLKVAPTTLTYSSL